jgi:hypothetical protein
MLMLIASTHIYLAFVVCHVCVNGCDHREDFTYEL